MAVNNSTNGKPYTTTDGLSGVVLPNFIASTVTTGSTITLAVTDPIYIVTNSATIAAATFVMPASPLANGYIQVVSTQSQITALTVSPNTGQSVVGAPTSLAAGGSFSMIFITGTWYPYIGIINNLANITNVLWARYTVAAAAITLGTNKGIASAVYSGTGAYTFNLTTAYTSTSSYVVVPSFQSPNLAVSNTMDVVYNSSSQFQLRFFVAGIATDLAIGGFQVMGS